MSHSLIDYLYTVISVLILIPLLASLYDLFCEPKAKQDKKGICTHALCRLFSIIGFCAMQIMFTITIWMPYLDRDNFESIVLLCIINTLWFLSEFMLIYYFIKQFKRATLNKKY